MFWSFLFFMPVYSNPQTKQSLIKDKSSTLKILIHSQIPKALIEIKGRHHIYNPLDGTQLSWGVVSKRHELVSTLHGIQWGERFIGHHQLRLVPGDSQSSILVNGIQYKGCIEIYLNDNYFTIINEVDIETCLKSILSNQFKEALPDELMSAVAIIARTNAYFEARRNPQAFWHLTAKEIDYQGAAFLSPSYIGKAVDSTRHAVISYQNALFPATWVKNSAGKTEAFPEVFRHTLKSPPGIDVPYAAREESQWSSSIPKEELAQAIHLPSIKSIDLYLTNPGNKVYAVKVSSDNQSKDYDFFTFQKIVGIENLRSNDFAVNSKGEDVQFVGFGDGHGVGLCLYGAQIMAKKGSKALEILTTFFPNTTLKKMD